VRFGAALAALYFLYSVVTDLAIWGGAAYYYFNGGF